MPDTINTLSVSKQTFVEDLTLGDGVTDVFLISSAQQAQSKNGPYWRLDFRDASGTIGGKIWSPHSQRYPDLAAGQFAFVTARVTSYRETLELAIDSMHILSDKEQVHLSLSDFMPASQYHPEDMLSELLALCVKECTHTPWLTFTHAVLSDPEIRHALTVAPAAQSMHHAYAAGLLEHTLSVCTVCMRLADHYPQLDRQVLLAGALCHDLGKIWELSSGLVTEYTTTGRLIGHISIALERLQPFIAQSQLEPELAEHLQHLVISHHGTLEFGSPKLPATAEAIILHYADNIDAKMQQVATALADIPDGSCGWSSYIPSLTRALYKAPMTPKNSSKAHPLDLDKDGSQAPGCSEQQTSQAQTREDDNDTTIQQHLTLL